MVTDVHNTAIKYSNTAKHCNSIGVCFIRVFYLLEIIMSLWYYPCIYMFTHIAGSLSEF